MRWMLDGAIREGLLVRELRVKRRYTLTEADGCGPCHQMGWVWALARYRRRPIPPGARVHASVRTRIAASADYGAKLPDHVSWDEQSWPFQR